MNMIDGEQAYPIYNISCHWTYLDAKGERNNNGTGSSKAYRTNPGKAMIEADARYVWWPKFQKSRPDQVVGMQDFNVKVQFLRYETWIQSWFEHWTFDNGQSDREILDSFQKFIYRMQYLNRMESYQYQWKDEKGKEWTSIKEPYCLMGAEDRWRWHGTQTGKPDERTDPPCRCEHCKKSGVIRIGH